MIPFSVLDLAPIPEGQTAAFALANSLDLARHAEKLGYLRYWLAEHHNMPGIASAATAVAICHVAGGTKSIRVGSGGIMLPNHSPLVIAEQFGTLASLFPGRIDLGLGRAPGTDQRAARAMRRDLNAAAERFPQDVLELQMYFEPADPGQGIRAIPGDGMRVPLLYILGSSLYGAQLAAILGMPFAFAAHFAPDDLMTALAIYREHYKPSEEWPEPYAMVGVGVFAAESDAEANLLFSSQQQQTLRLRRGMPGQLPPPVADLEAGWGPTEHALIDRAMAEAIVGSPATVKSGLASLLDRTKANELIIAAQIYDHAARKRSYEIVAGVRQELA